MYGPVLLYVFGRRAWCRYLCPIGAFLKIFSKVKIGGVRLVNDKCIGCAKCNRACDMQVDVLGDINKYSEVRNSACIVCLKCIDTCPTDAIALSLRHSDASLSDKAAVLAERSTLKRRKMTAFDLTISVVWIGVSLFFAFSGVNANAPQEMKVLMSVGLLLIVYGLAWAVWKGFSKFWKRAS